MGRSAGRDILTRSKAFATAAIRAVRALPSDVASRQVARQLVRSATSVGANLHEADMADTVPDFCSKVNIAQKEAAEAAYWASLIREAGITLTDDIVRIEAEATELQKICRQVVFASRQGGAK